jgi:hypothetical protein
MISNLNIFINISDEVTLNLYLMKYLFILFVALLFTGCSTTKILDESKLVMSMEKLQCLGSCPTFKLSIYNNRTAIFEGYRYTSMDGKFKTRLRKEKYKDMINHFQEAGFFEMNDVYTANIMDGQSTYVYFKYDGREKKILDYFKAPKALKELEKMIEDLILTENWKDSK